jgi:hypothetical protein
MSLSKFAVSVACLLASLTSGAQAADNDLIAFLERAEAMCTLNRAVRADVTIRGADGSTDQALLVISPGAPGAPATEFAAVRSNGFRALVPVAWQARGTAVSGQGASPAAISGDDPLGGTDLRAIDFSPFWKADYTTAFIHDANRLEKTVSFYGPDDVPYKLFVVTFDKAQLIPRQAKYYRESFNNLVRLRTDSGHAMVGSRPLPSRIVFNDYTENTERTYDIRWTVLETVPGAMFDKASFATAPIEWPEPAAPAVNPS